MVPPSGAKIVEPSRRGDEHMVPNHACRRLDFSRGPNCRRGTTRRDRFHGADALAARRAACLGRCVGTRASVASYHAGLQSFHPAQTPLFRTILQATAKCRPRVALASWPDVSRFPRQKATSFSLPSPRFFRRPEPASLCHQSVRTDTLADCETKSFGVVRTGVCGQSPYR